MKKNRNRDVWTTRITSAAAFVLLCLVGSLLPAKAQEDYAPQGVAKGSFRAFPMLYSGIFYDDNVFRTSSGPISDYIYNFGGALAVQSNWNNHALNFTAAADRFQFDKFTEESRTEWSVGADTRLDIRRGESFTAAASYATRYEPRNSANTPSSAASPIEYRALHAEAVLGYRPARVGFEIGANYDRYDYDNVRLIGGGLLNNQDRDMRIASVWSKAAYEFSPGYAAFARLTYNSRDFEQRLDRFGVNRDSNGYAVEAGVDMRVTALISGNFYGGWFQQNYRAPLADISGFNFGAALTWSPTQLLTVKLNAARRLVDTTVPGASASNETSVVLGADFSITRDILLFGALDYVEASFSGTNRDDETVIFAAGLRYRMNRYMSAEARYTYQTRESSELGAGFDANSFMALLNFHL